MVLLVLVILAALAACGVWVGLSIVRALRDGFDELMPQRMVDYAGFVALPLGRD